MALMLVFSFVGGHSAFATAAPSPASVLWLCIYLTNLVLIFAYDRGLIPGAAVLVVGAMCVALPHVVIGDDEAALRGAIAMATLFYYSRLAACVADPAIKALPPLEVGRIGARSLRCLV